MAKRGPYKKRQPVAPNLSLETLLVKILELEAQNMALSAELQAAIDRNAASTAALNTKVDALIASHAAGASDADQSAAAAALNTSSDALDAEAAKITA